MKVKSILKDKKLIFLQSVIIKGDEVEVEVDIPDDFVEVIDQERLEKMDFFELAEFIWKDTNPDQRPYKELIGEALLAKHKGEL